MVENSIIASNSSFKRRAIKAGILINECVECGIKDTWNNKPINLHLDHINGINTDYRKENLRMLCPNCHSQTSTYCGRNKKHTETTIVDKTNGTTIRMSKSKPKAERKCLECPAIISYGSIRCKPCASLFKKCYKIEWPDLETLEEMLAASNYWALSKELGVSDNAIRKHIKTARKLLARQQPTQNPQ